MGDKSPKSKAKNKKQNDASKVKKVVAPPAPVTAVKDGKKS